MSAIQREPSESVNESLTADHVRLDRCFATARQLAAAGRSAEASVTFEAFASGLRHHIQVEDELLFPVLESRLGLVGPTHVMRHEHRLIENLLLRAAEWLAAGDGEGFARAAASLAELLGAHNFKEERVLYPRSDAALGTEERAELNQRLALR
jgi:hemerythrin-like domain-containing protein